MGLDGLGTAAGKASDYVQGRAERRRNDIAKLEKEQDVLKLKKNKTVADKKRLDAIASRLGELYHQGANQA